MERKKNKKLATQSVQAESQLDEVYVMNVYIRIEHLVKYFPFRVPSQSTPE